MKQLDTFYRALNEYKRITGSNTECETFLRALSAVQSKAEGIELTKTVCTVDTHWVDAIEQGLVHIASAIGEERQFILSEGEVLPIEKVKTVSPESVKHLAKHSNLISRPPINGEIIPDSIYSVERLNDYTVYENRFLYMLLCYLRDFVSVRLEKITAFSHKYAGTLLLEKSLQLGGRSLSYRIDLTEECKNDPYLRDHNANKEIIERISAIFRTILSLLSTSLMEDVSKSPTLKPPITKTNVLKMDKHFRGAVELYDYIMAYEGQGYTVQEEKISLSPFDDMLSLDFAQICSALSFLTYVAALDIDPELKHRFEAQEEKRKAEKIKLYNLQLAQIKQRMQNGEIEPEEYIHALEKKFSALEAAFESTERLTEKLGFAEREILSLREENTALDAQNSRLDDALQEDRKLYEERCEELQAEFMQTLALTNEENFKKQNELEDSYLQKIEQIHQSLAQALQENAALKAEREELLQEKLIDEARIKAILANNGETLSSFTDKESFDQLEKEYEAFTHFYKLQWKKAKKEIRKSLLSFDALRGQKGDKDE